MLAACAQGAKYRNRLLFRLSRVKFNQGGVSGLRANVAGRSGDPPRRGGEGKLELTEAPRSETVAEGIPEGFRPSAYARGTTDVA